MARLKREVEGENGWSEWILPRMRGYKLACCDCGLIHRMEFKVVKVTGKKKGGWLNYETKAGFKVLFRASRSNRSTAQMRRHKK